MQLNQTPARIYAAFASTGSKVNPIPVPSQTGVGDGASASWLDGFPPKTRTLIASGGIPPKGLDINGVLYMMSAWQRWQSAGGGAVYDGTFASDSNVGGYPKGARVLRADGTGYWLNQTDNNTTDPDAGGAGWVPDLNYGITAITGLTNSNVTLTALQYAKPIITLSGTLTGNVQIIFPSLVGEWAVVNNTTGAFTVTCKTASGAGPAVPRGCSSFVWCDATNVYANLDGMEWAQIAYLATAASLTPDPTNAAQFKSALDALYAPLSGLGYRSGHTYTTSDWAWLDKPGGLIVQWGTSASVASDSNVTVTFPTSFASACFAVLAVPISSGSGVDNFASVISKSTTNTVIGRGFISGTTGETNPMMWLAIGV